MENRSLRIEVEELKDFLITVKGEDVVALALDEKITWARYCLICTCNSLTHMRGVFVQVKDRLEERGFEILSPQNKLLEDSWCLVDAGSLVLHLMRRDTREFYDLEHLLLGEKLSR